MQFGLIVLYLGDRKDPSVTSPYPVVCAFNAEGSYNIKKHQLPQQEVIVSVF